MKKYIYIAMFAVALIFLSGCDSNKVIMSNLSQEQANQVLSVLQQYNIDSEKSGTPKDGYSVLVNNKDLTVALSIVNEYGLPRMPETQLSQVFANDSLVSSPIVEQSKLIEIEEQKLEYAIKLISPVVNASVHISYPLQDNGYFDKKPTEHVSVLIIYKDELDSNDFINQIKTLVKNSLDNVLYENISVVLFPKQKTQYYQLVHKESSATKVFPIIVIIILVVIIILLLCYLILVKDNFKLSLKSNNKDIEKNEEDTKEESETINNEAKNNSDE